MRIGLILPLLSLGCALDIVRPGEDVRFNAISAGDSHTCALTDDGVAWCWGSNSHGQLGIGGGHESEARPAAVSSGLHYRTISAGRQHTCAIGLGGNGWCWGANDSGQLGDGTLRDRHVPKLVALPRRLSSISSGRDHSCATDASGTVLCWGSNDHGQSGAVSGAAIRVPSPVIGAPVASRVSVGDNHSCAVGTAGLFCWGANDRVQLGSATLHESPLPVRVSIPGLASDVSTGAGGLLGRQSGYAGGPAGAGEDRHRGPRTFAWALL
jgi:alpha-tubulin suppressor-like RCC1 family protein